MPRRGSGRGGVKLANPHGADLTQYMKRGAPKPDFKKSRAAEPTVDQIQVDCFGSLEREDTHKLF